MDTLHFEPETFHGPEGRRSFRDDEAGRTQDVNLSEVEVFMLRGRRLQAQAIGWALRQALASLRRLLRRSRSDPGPAGQPRCHRHASAS
jgi:hypothetical protein